MTATVEGLLFSECTDAVMRIININTAWYSEDCGCVQSGSDADVMLLSRDRQTGTVEGMKADEAQLWYSCGL